MLASNLTFLAQKLADWTRKNCWINLASCGLRHTADDKGSVSRASTCPIYKTCSLHLKNINVSTIWQPKRALCGRSMMPPLLKIRSTGALLAGTESAFKARECKAGYLSLPTPPSIQKEAASIGFATSRSCCRYLVSWPRGLRSLSPLFDLFRRDWYLAWRRGTLALLGISSSPLVPLDKLSGLGVFSAAFRRSASVTIHSVF